MTDATRAPLTHQNGEGRAGSFIRSSNSLAEIAERFPDPEHVSFMLNLQVITASTRPGRQGPLVTDWFLGCARAHGKFDVEPVDLAEVNLPVFDEPIHPRLAQYEHEHTRAWSALVQRADAFVVVTPEYDYATPAALVNALQYLVREWAYKPMGFVSYGGVSGGTRGVQMTKQIVTTLKVMPIPEAVAIPFFAQHVDSEVGRFDPGEVQAKAASVMLDELLRWATALRPMRFPTLAPPLAGAPAG